MFNFDLNRMIMILPGILVGLTIPITTESPSS